ncbi:unnamed protein product, partial [Mesorhabditis belari]
MYVPPYNDGPTGGANRDPRLFQGLAGVQAPPPYPPPPDYNQLESIPELPSIVNMRLPSSPTAQSTGVVPSQSQCSTTTKTDSFHEAFPPVD